MTNALLHLKTPTSQSHELEALVLGAVLASDDAGRLMDLGGLSDTHLQSPRIQLCWKLARRLVAEKKRVDAITVFSAGQTRHLLADNDHAWLQQLEAQNVLDGDRFVQVCADLRKMAHARKIHGELEQLTRGVAQDFRPGLLSGELDAMQRDLAGDYIPTHIGSQYVVDFATELGRPKAERKSFYTTTGIKVLDDLCKGLVPTLNVVLADPQIGKSALVGSMMTSQLEQGMRVGLFPLEGGAAWLPRRVSARAVGMSVADMLAGNQMNEEQAARFETICERMHEWFQRLYISPPGTSAIDEVCRRMTAMILQYGAQVIYIDHIGEIRHRTGVDRNWAVAETYQRLRDLGERYKVPVVVLAHRPSSARDRVNGPPRPFEIGLTGEAEKMVRLMFGLWRKDGELRATVIKNNEGKSNVTAELEFIDDAALVTSDGGRIVNLQEERRKEQEIKAAEKQEKADAMFVRNRDRAQKAADKDKKAKEKAVAEAKAAEEAERAKMPQLTLLDGGGPKPPEDPRDS